MKIYDLFSYRNRDITTEPDVYVYDKIPMEVRNYYLHIIADILRSLQKSDANAIRSLCISFARQKGLMHIDCKNIRYRNTWAAYQQYTSECSDIDFLDLMDYSLNSLIGNIEFEKHNTFNHGSVQTQRNNILIECIDELNERLKRHHLGYEFCNGMVIKKTNKVTHETIVKPALKLLCDEEFKGAEDEYLKAWKQFMDGDNQGAILNAAKAFESFMKIICSKMHYSFDKEKDTAKKLLEHLKSNNFFPSYLENHLNALITTLESGAPTVRNKTSGHGQGEERISVPDDYATYVLNLVASNIVFLHSIYKEHHSDK